MNNIYSDLKKEENEKNVPINEDLPFKRSILPDRFNSISEPRFGGIIDIGPETSLPMSMQVLIEISK